jgi:hypothetical protein
VLIVGESDPVVLEFDHIENKRYNLSLMINKGYAIKTMEQELSNCVVRCSNCHARLTAKQQNWYKK